MNVNAAGTQSPKIKNDSVDSSLSLNVDEGDVSGEAAANPERKDAKAEGKREQTEQELLYCKFCEFQATDLARYVNHVHKPSHIKKAAEAYKIRLVKESTVPSQFHCQVCLISCNGENAWNQHLMGQKHRKVLERKAAMIAEQKQVQQASPRGGGPMRNTYYGNAHFKKPYEKTQRIVQQPTNIPSQALGAKDFANYPEPLIGLEYVTEIQVTGQSPRYQCSLCDAKFDHNLKFPHLVGAKHRMNVLKIKRPNVLQEARNQTQKRSELTAMLLRESRKLEQEEGRQQVATKVEKSPFNAVNSSPWNSQTYEGNQGIKRSQTGTGTFTRGGTTSRGNRGTNGGRGTFLRGENRGSSRGRGKGWSGTYGSFGGRGQGNSYSSPNYNSNYAPPSNSRYDTQPYDSNYDSYDKMSDFEKRGNILPSEQFHPQSPLPTSNFQQPSKPGCYSAASSSLNSTAETSKAEESNRPELSSSLAGALGDLTKLVQNEDDASVALHVSNALTQALLQYRMTNIQDEV